MTETLLDYQLAVNTLPDEAFLGQLTYFTITETDVNFETAKQLLDDLGLQPVGMRKRLRGVDAYKKAANEVAHKFDRRGDEHHSFLVRQVGQDSETSHRHIVLERAIYKTGQRRKLAYDVVATVVYDRTENDVTVTKMDPVGYTFNAEEKAWLDIHLDGLAGRFEHWSTHLDAHAVRTFVRSYLSHMSAISVRPNGSLYFVPQTKLDELTSLAAWVKKVGSSFHTVPLLKIEEQKEMLSEAYEQDLLTEIGQLTDEITKILKSPTRTITQDTFDAYADQAATLMARTDEYADLLETHLSSASTAAGAFRIQVLQMASRIKTPGERKKMKAASSTTSYPSGRV
jgi:hypothetical protein